MPSKSQKLNALARDRLAYLTQKTGHSITVDDFDSIARLNILAGRVVSGSEDAVQTLVSGPVPCGNITLRKPSIGKLFWFQDNAVEWFKDEPDMYDLIFAYLLSKPNENETTDVLLDRKTTRKVVNKWARKLTATEDEFSKAMATVYPAGDGDGDDPDDPAREAPICALLSREYGENPSWWLWEAPLDMTQAMISDYTQRMEAEHMAQRRAATGGKGFHKGGSAKPIPPSVTPSIRHQKRLREYVNSLEKRWANA